MAFEPGGWIMARRPSLRRTDTISGCTQSARCRLRAVGPNRSPDRAEPEDLWCCQLHLASLGASYARMNAAGRQRAPVLPRRPGPLGVRRPHGPNPGARASACRPQPGGGGVAARPCAQPEISGPRREMSSKPSNSSPTSSARKPWLSRTSKQYRGILHFLRSDVWRERDLKNTITSPATDRH